MTTIPPPADEPNNLLPPPSDAPREVPLLPPEAPLPKKRGRPLGSRNQRPDRSLWSESPRPILRRLPGAVLPPLTPATMLTWQEVLGERIGGSQFLPIFLGLPEETLLSFDPPRLAEQAKEVARVLQTTEEALRDPRSLLEVAEKRWPKLGLDPWFEDQNPADLRKAGLKNEEIGQILGLSKAGVTRTIQRGSRPTSRAQRFLSEKEILAYTVLEIEVERMVGGYWQLCRILGVPLHRSWRTTVLSNEFFLTLAATFRVHPSEVCHLDPTERVLARIPQVLADLGPRPLTIVEKENFRLLLDQCRQKVGTTELARRLDIFPAAISGIVAGAKSIGMTRISALASLLGVTSGEVLAGQVSPSVIETLSRSPMGSRAAPSASNLPA